MLPTLILTRLLHYESALLVRVTLAGESIEIGGLVMKAKSSLSALKSPRFKLLLWTAGLHALVVEDSVGIRTLVNVLKAHLIWDLGPAEGSLGLVGIVVVHVCALRNRV